MRLQHDFKPFDALVWMPELKLFALNREDYVFLDMFEILCGYKDFTWPLFIRPTSGRKEFSGNVFTLESWRNEEKYAENRNIGNPICMISSPQKLGKEYRCIFINGKYVAGSQYMDKGEKSVDPEVPEEVKAYAIKISEDDFFINLFEFVIDVVETDKGLRMVEINCFNTASFYAADLDVIYSTWAKVGDELY